MLVSETEREREREAERETETERDREITSFCNRMQKTRSSQVTHLNSINHHHEERNGINQIGPDNVFCSESKNKSSRNRFWK